MAYPKLENFRIKKKIASKLCYSAYDAVDKRTGIQVCLKLLFPEFDNDKNTVFDFINGARVAQKLDHPNIYKIYDFGQDEDFHYISSEPIEYPPFSALILDNFSLYLEDLLKIFSNIGETLRFAHLNGMIHGLLNPGSIYINSEEDIKIDDLGFNWFIPKVFEQDLPASRDLAQYIAPEYYKGLEMMDGRGDIYSLGVILFHLIHGRPPFTGESLADIQVQHLRGRLPALNLGKTKLPADIAPLIENSLCRFREKRFQNLNQFLSTLENVKRKYLIPEEPELSEKREAESKPAAAVSATVKKIRGSRLLRFALPAFGLLILLAAVIFGITNFIGTPNGDDANDNTINAALSTFPEQSDASEKEPLQPVANGSEEFSVNGAETETSSGNLILPQTETSVPDPEIESVLTSEQTSGNSIISGPTVTATFFVRSGTLPISANIFLNNQFVGKTAANGKIEIDDLEPGKSYTARVYKEGYTALSKDFKPSETNVSLTFDIKRTPEVYGTLVLDAVPKADSVFVDGKLRRGKTPMRVKLRSGTHSVRLVNSELNKQWAQKVDLKVGQVMRVKPDFTQVETGKIAVSLKNAFEFGFGYVYVDGELWDDKNNTTPLEISLSVGAHKIELKRPGFAVNPKEVKVTIDKNVTKYVSFTFNRVVDGAN